MNRIGIVAVLLFAVVIIGCNQKPEDTPTSGTVRFAVAESQVDLMQQEIVDFQKMYPNAKVEIVPTTTRGAIVFMLNDSIRFICTDRPLNAEELAVANKAGLEFHQLRIAEDALAIIVNKENPATEISMKSLNDIVSGRVQNWRDVAESKWNRTLTIGLTGRNSGTYELLVKTFLKLGTDPQPAFVAPTQSELAKYVSATPGAIGVVGVAALHDSSLNVRPLSVEGLDSSTGAMTFVKLHQANIYRSLYPLHYPVYFYSTAGGRSVAAGFTSFVAANAGQKIIQNFGLAPATVPVRLVQLHQE